MTRGGVTYWTDPAAEQLGVIFGFTERGGGVSEPPFASLDLAAHVGDAPDAVDENRSRALTAMGIGGYRDRLVVAEQVHGADVKVVSETDAGRGAWASASPHPVPATDALLTATPRLPLLMCFADCVPVVLVAPGPAVCVVHAGWRGALAGISASAAVRLARFAHCGTEDLTAYIGPHIGGCCYETDARILSQFVNDFGTFARAESGALDLGAVTQQNLTDAGVSTCRITSLGRCTAEETEKFFSYRAEGGLTGRHGAIACIP